MKNDLAITDIADLRGNRYPHLKLTRERFPRLLATRRIEDDGDEYFGAFLTRTSIRIVIDLLNKTFRLRNCDLDLDGGFAVPCTQLFRRRCEAPCNAEFCSEAEYMRIVSLVRLFLTNNRGGFRKAVLEIIDKEADNLDFEAAAKYRDILLSIEKYWQNDRMQIWLDDTVDTFAVEDTPEGTAIFLVSQRGRRVLGRKVFSVDREDFESSDQALSKIIDSFYAVHIVKEIRVSRDFHGRKMLEQKLSERHNRSAKIIVVNPKTKGINAYRGLMLSHDEHELDKAKPLASPDIISSKLRRIFDLDSKPNRIRSFDVAHISATGFVAASAVWEQGRYISEDYKFEISGLKSEISVLAAAVRKTLLDSSVDGKMPELVLLDGGKPQLNAVIKAVADLAGVPPIVAAVKPPGKHSSIAAFLTSDGRSIAFDVDSPAHAMLQVLRDEAHSLANRTHRDYREMKPFYEAKGFDEPLIVPIRLHAENGGAEDLIPIESR